MSQLSHRVYSKMVLDIEIFRDDKGGDSKKIKENQAKRYKDVTKVDRVVEVDSRWRKCKILVIQHFVSRC